MTAGVDQKIGRDAIERYQVLKKELDALKAEVESPPRPGELRIFRLTARGSPSSAF